MGNLYILMQVKDPNEILEQLRKNNFAPVYFLQSEEPYFIDQVSDYIEQHALNEADRAFNQVILYGKEVKMTDVLNHARKFPMMAERQLVLVKEAQEMSEWKKGEEGPLKWLIQYVEQPLASTILVFAYKNSSLDGRSKLVKILSEKAVFLNAKKLYENQIPDWIQRQVKTLGLQIHPQSVQLLAGATGANISRLSKELDKLSLNLKPGEEIKPIHIETFVGISREYNVFELQKALGSKNIYEAYKIARSIAADTKNNPEVVVIANLFSFFQKIFLLKKAQITQDAEVARVLGVNIFFAKDYLNAARNYSLVQIKQSIHALRKADLRIKGLEGAMETSEVYKEMVYQMMH